MFLCYILATIRLNGNNFQFRHLVWLDKIDFSVFTASCLVFFEIRSCCVSLAGLELTMEIRLASNPQSPASWLLVLSVHHYSCPKVRCFLEQSNSLLNMSYDFYPWLWLCKDNVCPFATWLSAEPPRSNSKLSVQDVYRQRP